MSYGRSFLLFQLSKYVWALVALGVLGTVALAVHAPPVAAVGSGLASLGVAVLAFRMTNQYRCPACRQLLAFAHGTSAGDGASTFVTACPFCAAPLR